MISELDKAYAAGFFDGEGSVFIERPRQRRGFTVVVSMGQNDQRPLLWIQSLWGGRIVPHNKGRSFVWRCNSAIAGNFLKDIYPYLKVKERVVSLALELQDTKSHALRNTPEYLIFCEDIHTKIKSVNLAT